MLNTNTVSITVTKGQATLSYSAPEVIEGDEKFVPTFKIDVYSFGITL